MSGTSASAASPFNLIDRLNGWTEQARALARTPLVRWYLLPFVPGMTVFLVGLFEFAMQRPHASEHARAIVLVFALTAAGCAVVFAGVGKLNHWAARKLQLSTESRRSLDTIPIERT